MSTSKNVRSWIGNASYDYNGQMIFRENQGGLRQFIDLRGWGAIRNAFKTEIEAAEFQDAVGEWVTNAINEQIKREELHEKALLEAGL